MRDTQKRNGLYKKYEVTRTDGKPIKGCFVIEFKDPHASVALIAYCNNIRPQNPELAEELMTAFYASLDQRPVNKENLS